MSDKDLGKSYTQDEFALISAGACFLVDGDVVRGDQGVEENQEGRVVGQ